MRSAKKLIRLGGCPGHWRKKVLNIGCGLRGEVVAGWRERNRFIAGPLGGHRSLSKFLHLCRLHLVFAGRIGYCVGFAMLWLIYI